MNIPRRVVGLTLMVVAMFVVQQVYLDASGASRAHAQSPDGEVLLGYAEGEGGDQVNVPITQRTNIDAKDLFFEFEFDPQCLSVVGGTAENVAPPFDYFVCSAPNEGKGQCIIDAVDPLSSYFGSVIGTIDILVKPEDACRGETFDLDPTTCVQLVGDPDPVPCDLVQDPGQVKNTTLPLAVSLSGFHAQQNESFVDFQWQTATETGTAGFNILAEIEANTIQLNGELIPSPVIDSVTLTDYRYLATTDATTFYLQEVGIDGRAL